MTLVTVKYTWKICYGAWEKGWNQWWIQIFVCLFFGLSNWKNWFVINRESENSSGTRFCGDITSSVFTDNIWVGYWTSKWRYQVGSLSCDRERSQLEIQSLGFLLSHRWYLKPWGHQENVYSYRAKEDQDLALGTAIWRVKNRRNQQKNLSGKNQLIRSDI